MTGANGGGVVGKASLRIAARVKPGSLSDAEDEEFSRLLGPAQEGDGKALAKLRPLLDKGDVWSSLGNLTRHVEEAWLNAMTESNKLVREAYERRAAELRRELLAAGDSQLERLLIDRVIVTWLQASHADGTCAKLLRSDGHTYQEGKYRQDRQDRAHARHLKAVKALATVRRLLVPAVQVNIAKEQIISQGAPAVAAPEIEA
jgi:hypothetical protein